MKAIKIAQSRNATAQGFGHNVSVVKARDGHAGFAVGMG
jgi:hypothetical protein